MYMAQEQELIPPRDKISIATKKFYYFNPTLLVSAISLLIHFEKMIFQPFPHTIAWERKFDLAVKGRR